MRPLSSKCGLSQLPCTRMNMASSATGRASHLAALRQRELRRWARRHVSFQPLEKRRLLAAGDFDSSFGNGGQVLSDYEWPQEHARGVAVQGDGKVLQSVAFTNALA